MSNLRQSSFRGLAIVFVLGMVAECAPSESGVLMESPRSGTAAGSESPATELSGQLVVHMLDFGGETLIRRTLRLDSGEQRELKFDEEPELASGTRLRVQVDGAGPSRAQHVKHFEILPSADEVGGVERSSSALINGMKKPTKKWGVVLVDTGAGVNITKEAITAKIFSDSADSIRSYYREVSYGLQDLTGEVIGPFKLSAIPQGGLCNNFSGIIDDLGAQVDAAGNYDQYLWYFGSTIRGCLWEGVALLGTAARPSQHSFYNAQTDCVVLVQEPGHNFGMVHSSAIHCTQDGVAVSMADPTVAGGACTHDEYGNPFDPMGGGNGSGGEVGGRCLHMNGVQKAYEDWIGGCNIVKAATSGTYTIYPLEQSCNGVQLLQVPLPQARAFSFKQSQVSSAFSGVISSYYVEFRAPVGLDSSLKTPHVFILGASDLRLARQSGNRNWLIDTTPATRSVVDAALGVGKTFADPGMGGPKITLVSADATKAVIKVELSGSPASDSAGTGTCSDDTPYNAAAASTCNDTATTPPGSADGGGVGTGGSGGGTPDAGGTGGMDNVDAEPPVTMTSDAAVAKDSGTTGTGGTRTDASLPRTGDAGGGKSQPTTTSNNGAVSGSCGCRLGGSQPGSAPVAAAAGMLALVLARRRRRR